MTPVFLRPRSRMYLYRACVQRLSSLSPKMISWVIKMTTKLDPREATCLFAYSCSKCNVKHCPTSGCLSHGICSGLITMMTGEAAAFWCWSRQKGGEMPGAMVLTRQMKLGNDVPMWTFPCHGSTLSEMGTSSPHSNNRGIPGTRVFPKRFLALIHNAAAGFTQSSSCLFEKCAGI